MKTKIIYEPIPKVVTNPDIDNAIMKALLISLKEKGLINHSQYSECLRKLK